MAENQSNLVEIYKASPFATIGAKVSVLAGKTVPKSGEIVDLDETAKQEEKLSYNSKVVDLQLTREALAKSPTSKINEFKTLNIEKIQSDFIELVVLPYGTLLELNSQYGNIFIKPMQSLSRFFDKINEPKKIEVGVEDSLINRDFQKFGPMPYKSSIKFDSPSGKLSTVNFIPNEVNTGFTANAYKGLTEFIEDKIPGVNPMPVTPDKPIGEINPMLVTPTKPVEELAAMPTTPSKQIAETNPMLETPKKPISNTTAMPGTPNKPFANLREMPFGRDKTTAELNPMVTGRSKYDQVSTPSRIRQVGIGSPDIPAESGRTIPMPDTPEKGAGKIADIMKQDTTSPTDELGKVNYIQDIYNKGFTLDALPKLTEFKFDEIAKTFSLGVVNYIADDYQTNFTIEQQFGQTQFKLNTDKKSSNTFAIPLKNSDVTRQAGLKIKHSPDDLPPDFTTKDVGADKFKTEYTLTDIPIPVESKPYPYTPYEGGNTDGKTQNIIGVTLYGFDFPNRVGVINQFDNYVKRYVDVRAGDILTPQGYANILARNILQKDPGPMNFFTPTVPIDTTTTGYRVYPTQSTPYMYWGTGQNNPTEIAKNSMPFWERLVNLGISLSGQFIGSSILNLVQQLTGVDTQPMKISPLGAHVVAGNLYYSIGGFKGSLESYKQSDSATPNFFISETISDVIGTVTGVVRGVQQATRILGISMAAPGELLSSDYAELGLMMAQILAGTKYTAAYAFYDPTVKQYSSRWAVTGDTAVNLYYNDDSRIDEINAGGKYSATGRMNARDKIDKALSLSIYSRYIAIDKSATESPVAGLSNLIKKGTSIAQDVQGAITKAANFINKGVFNLLLGGNPALERKQGERILGSGFEQLVNPAMLVEDSLTFGTYKVRIGPDRTYEYWVPLSVDNPYTYSSSDRGAKSPNVNYINIWNLPYGTDKRFKAAREALKDVVSDLAESIASLGTSIATGGGLGSIIGDGGISNDSNLNSLKLSLKNPFSRNDFKDLYSEKLKSTMDRVGDKTIQDRGIPADGGNLGGTYIDKKNATSLQKLRKDKSGNVTEYDDSDLIDFYFEDITSGGATDSILIAFRAIITDYSDSTSADWQTQTYVGRPDKFYIYGGFDRKVTISFDVAINSKKEFIPIWQKLNYLQGMCYPVDYPANVSMTSPILALTVGNLLNRVYVVMNSINFNFDSSTLWEIEDGYQMPLYIKVNVDFNVLYDSIPKSDSRHFAHNQDWIILPKKLDPEQPWLGEMPVYKKAVSNTRPDTQIFP